MATTTQGYGDTQSNNLTELESMILILISRDCSDAQIAHILATSTETIECAINGLFSKLGLTSRLAATV